MIGELRARVAAEQGVLVDHGVVRMSLTASV
jgi:hypothetical protein